MITVKRKLALDSNRREWGKTKPAIKRGTKRLPSAERVVSSISALAKALKTMQDIYHRSGGHATFTRREIGGIVNALIHEWPIPHVLLRSKGARRSAKGLTTLEHDPPISFFRDLLMSPLKPDLKEWTYVLLKHLRVVWILKTENKKLTKRKWKQNRPEDAYAVLNIHFDDDSAKRHADFRSAARKAIARLLETT